ncbi:MAG: hypothetical protein OQK32_05550 [Gammaproteobacteria bacterium]|nr:hypothetical protein [Gammaproteobacteria bacterium]MCW8922400.1 hypothetical protein [Gammaproteobacteria bacterium]
MNETAWIFTGLVAFGVGYGLAHFVKRMGDLAERWGIFVVFLFPIIIIYLTLAAAMLADLHNIVISLIFAGGFLIRIMRKR